MKSIVKLTKQTMNKSSKLLSIILTICMILSATGIMASAETVETISVRDITIPGETMSVSDYKDLYGKPIAERKSKQEINTYQNATIKINEISISNEEITFDYEIGEFQETLEGALYNSSRNMNNIVAVFEDETDYDILFFEITKGTEEINLLYNTALNSKPHIKIYMKDTNDKMYLFETELPEQLINLTINNDNACDVYNDYLWYVNIAEAYQTTVNTSCAAMNIIDNSDPNYEIKRNIAIASNTSYEPEMSVATTTSTEPMMWGGKQIYEMSVTNGVDQTTYMFYPYGYIRGCNVANGSNSTWWGSVEVSEHTATKMIGSPSDPTVTYGINRFSVRNPKISVVSGNYTMMVRYMIDGKTKTLSGSTKTTGQKIASKVFKKVLSAVPYGKTASEILDWLSLIPTQVTDEVTLGSNGISLNSSAVSATKLEVDSNYVFSKYTEASGGGHKIVMHVDVTRTTNSTAMTTGAVRINYDVYTNLYDKHDSHQVEKSFLYSNTDYDNGYRDYYYY